MNTSQQPAPILARPASTHSTRFAPLWQWSLICTLLAISFCFPWMYLSSPSFMSFTPFFDSWGGPKQQYGWIALCLIAFGLASVSIPRRQMGLLVFLVLVIYQVWYEYNEFTGWMRLAARGNVGQTDEIYPTVTVGEGWYLRVTVLLLGLVWWFSRNLLQWNSARRDHR